MTINECSIILHEEDLTRFVRWGAQANKKIKGLRVDLQDDKIIVSGRLAQLLNVSFQATLDAAHTDTEIIVRLESVRPMNALLGQLKEKILRTISERVDFIQHDKLNDAIRIDVNKALEKRFASASVTIKKCSVSTNDVALTLQGDLLFS